MALINCIGGLGGFFGTYLVGVLQTYTGSPAAGFLLMSLSLILSGVLLLGMGRPDTLANFGEQARRNC
jgi:MFS-type transporter involved in bile tolerance (Atg22 family)